MFDNSSANLGENVSGVEKEKHSSDS